MTPTQAQKFARKKSSAGLGLFAKKPFTKDDFVIEYTGKKISHDQADKKGGRYLFTLNKKWVVDGTGRENLARYLNHSCDPNCEAFIEGGAKINIYAKKNIAPGEELTYDYGKEYVTDIIKAEGCLCSKCAA